ncbi:MAG: hypothetical protein LBH40_03830 [Alphaproteobacteria bacterium]|jgi:opacity protein-like surface antigen|nr:hypothetical protein [Alphaproteobacteria bacterium]
MKISTLIFLIFTISILPSVLQSADKDRYKTKLLIAKPKVESISSDGFGYYVGGGIGITRNSNIKINNINRTIPFQTSTTTNVSYRYNDSINCPDCYVDVTTNSTFTDTYTALLKEINFTPALTPYVNVFTGFAINNIRIEAELKSMQVKLKPKNVLYDINRISDYEMLITTICHQAGGFNNICKDEASDIPIETIMSGQTQNTFNNVLLGANDTFFSANIDRNLFYKTSGVDTQQYIGLINLLYELALAKHYTLFAGVGLGYGSAKINGGHLGVKALTYPVYQYKIGAYYSYNDNIDFTVNYSYMNMVGVPTNSAFTIADTNFQSIEFGIRYNFFKRNPTFYYDYNYKNVFHPNE